jgi:hypothetical protein
MSLASLIVSGLSLVTVVIIGVRSVRLGERSTRASEESTLASVNASESSERAAIASEKAAEATRRSARASEVSASVSVRDAQIRRTEALLEVVLQMRELFNSQEADNDGGNFGWSTPIHSPESLARLALTRRLEGRLVLFAKEFDMDSPIYQLTDPLFGWRSSNFEQAILDVKSLIVAAANME